MRLQYEQLRCDFDHNHVSPLIGSPRTAEQWGEAHGWKKLRDDDTGLTFRDACPECLAVREVVNGWHRAT